MSSYIATKRAKGMFRPHLTVILMLCVAWINAQVPSFIHYSVDDGLPSNLIYAMTQDQDGFLWFSTDKGLARFDGHRFHLFGMEDGLSDSEILNIKSDSKGRLWISPFRQNPAFWQNGRFHTVETDSFLKKVNYQVASVDFQETEPNNIWVFGMEPSAYVLRDTIVQPVKLSECPRKLFASGSDLFCLGNNYITKITPDKTGDEIVFNIGDALGNTGLNFDYEGVDFSGRLILYCRGKLLILVEYTEAGFKILDKRTDITGRVFAGADGDFWVCNLGTGVSLVNCSSGKILLKSQLLEGKKVNFMYKDRQNTKWFCTIDEGIYGLPLNSPASYIENRFFKSGNITSLAQSFDYSIMAGDDEANVYTIQGKNVRCVPLQAKKTYNRVLGILPVDANKIYVATDKAIYRLHDNALEKSLTDKDRITAPKAINYYNNRLWAAHAYLIGYYHNDDQDYRTYFTRRYTSLGPDNEGITWAGGIEGLYSEPDGFVYNWGDKFPELKWRIVTLLKSKPGYLWVVTSNHDLLRVSVSKGQVTGTEIMNKVFSKPVKNIKCLFLDKKENLWMGTNRGVYVLKPDQSILHFDKHDGLADDDINTLLVQEDTLWIGTTKGLTRMQLHTNPLADSFPTFIVGMDYKLHGKSYYKPVFKDFKQTNTLEVPAEAGLIEINLAGLDYSSRGNIQFEYVQEKQLPPLLWLTLNNLIAYIFNSNKAEKTLISDHTLNLGARLPPGKYLLQFTAINTQGIRSSQSDAIIVIQRPHWYETLWFWLGLWVVVGFIARKMIRDRSAYRDLNASVSKLRLQALQAQMNPHFIGNSIYAIQQFFYPPDPEKASEYIELFNRLFRQSMLMAERHFVTFNEDLEYYHDYLQMIQLRLGDRFNYVVSGADKIPPNTPFPAMILQPIIENATIHGLALEGVSNLRINFTLQGSEILTTIEDNGEGIETTRARKEGSPRKSKGLELIYQKINTLNKLYNINLQLQFTDLGMSDPAKHGTRVTLVYQYVNIKSQETIPAS